MPAASLSSSNASPSPCRARNASERRLSARSRSARVDRASARVGLSQVLMAGRFKSDEPDETAPAPKYPGAGPAVRFMASAAASAALTTPGLTLPPIPSYPSRLRTAPSRLPPASPALILIFFPPVKTPALSPASVMKNLGTSLGPAGSISPTMSAASGLGASFNSTFSGGLVRLMSLASSANASDSPPGVSTVSTDLASDTSRLCLGDWRSSPGVRYPRVRSRRFFALPMYSTLPFSASHRYTPVFAGRSAS